MSSKQDDQRIDLFTRPRFQLRSLPLNIRWEVSRRHPVYQCYWRSYIRHLDLPQDVEAETEDVISQFSFVALARIGVTGCPPDPTYEFEQLDNQTMNSSWMSGAIQPVTNRGLIGLLLASLPKSTLRDIGTSLINASFEDTENVEPYLTRELRRLAYSDLDGLDDLHEEPIVSINPASSVRQVRSMLEELMVQWKADRGLTEQRTRHDKYDEYLRVWDLREGWLEGRYNRSRETSLKGISRELGKPLTSIHNQYRSAYQLITGYQFSIVNWLTVFGLIKLTEVLGAPGVATTHRPLVKRTDREIPDSVLASSAGRLAFTESQTFSSDQEHIRLYNDILRMIDAGSSNQEIVIALDLSHPEIVAYLRDRKIDGLF